MIQMIVDLLDGVPEEKLRRLYFFIRAYLEKD